MHDHRTATLHAVADGFDDLGAIAQSDVGAQIVVGEGVAPDRVDGQRERNSAFGQGIGGLPELVRVGPRPDVLESHHGPVLGGPIGVEQVEEEIGQHETVVGLADVVER